MKINGTPQPDKNRNLGGKKLNKPVAAAGSGGAASGGGCGQHALVADPTAWSAADAMVGGLVAAALVAVTVWTLVALVAWRQRGER